MAKKSTSQKKETKTKDSKKSAPEKDTAKTAELSKELLKIIKELNTEHSLAFLIKQALVLKHNEQVEELNKNAEKYNVNNYKHTGKKKSIKKPEGPGMDKNSAEIVEADDGSNFIIVVNMHRNFFARDEMKKVVKLCHVASGVDDASARLFNWLNRERLDVIRNSHIDGPGDPSLASIYNKIIKTYTVKE